MSVTGIRWAGPRAQLVELSDLGSVLALRARLFATPLPGQVDAVAAAATVLVRFRTHADALAARTEIAGLDLIAGLDSGVSPESSRREVTIGVVYDGEDLAEVGRLTGLGADGVVAAHTGQLWTAAFSGFAPGFTYLAGENQSLDIPRRSSPRTAVPAGSVALGGRFSAVYPRRSPGGWQLIGHTAARMWDLDREQPALVRPGDTVRYVAVREAIDVAAPLTAPSAGAPSLSAAAADDYDDGPALVVESPGLLSLVQDLGRPGLGDLGVSAAGAADQRSARQANRIVGNQPGDAVVESLLGGLCVRAAGDLVLAVSGAQVPLEILDTAGIVVRRADMRAPFALLDGETLALGAPSAGLRSYLAVRGGVDVPPVLGSRSTDTMSGIGPLPLAVGTRLRAGAAASFAAVGPAESSTLEPGAASGTAHLRITLGPREDWFTADSVTTLIGQDWTVTAQSNRIGVRLTPGPEGAALRRSRDGELPSEGAVAGALQVPPSGHPVLFLAEHPVTAGYPVIAVVVPEDLPVVAQLPPGHNVRFTIVDAASLEPVENGATAVASKGSQP